MELQRLATSRAAAAPAGLEQARRRRVTHSADWPLTARACATPFACARSRRVPVLGSPEAGAAVFGTTPPYLVKIKQEIADEYEYIRSMQQQDDSGVPPGMKQLPEEERQALVDALKSKWQDVNKAYQGSCVLSLKSLDTIGKVKRKEMYEAQLAQIEKDIEKLSRKVILVADD